MKLYATTTSERATKGQGGNKQVAVTFQIGSANNSKYILTIMAQVTPKEASIAEREMVVFTIFQEGENGGRIGEKLVFDLETGQEVTSRSQALELKELKAKKQDRATLTENELDILDNQKAKKQTGENENVAGTPNALKRLFDSLPVKDKLRQ